MHLHPNSNKITKYFLWDDIASMPFTDSIKYTLLIKKKVNSIFSHYRLEMSPEKCMSDILNHQVRNGVNHGKVLNCRALGLL